MTAALPPCPLGFGNTRLRLTDCFLEVEQTEEGKHSWELGEGDPCMALKERRRAGCFVAAGQLGTSTNVVHI